MKFVVKKINELEAVSIKILNHMPVKVFALYGEMGAGKTTLIKAFCKQLGCIHIVNSPTFAIVNEYHTKNNSPVYHFDFYRIKSLEEVYDIGYEEYFYSGYYCFIEWAEYIEQLLPENHLKIYIKNDKGLRKISI